MPDQVKTCDMNDKQYAAYIYAMLLEQITAKTKEPAH